jgi:acetyltransferase-like isoleucine patch superfamily enzyme
VGCDPDRCLAIDGHFYTCDVEAEVPLSQSRALLDRARRIASRVGHAGELWREEPMYRSYLRRRVMVPVYRRQFHHFGEKVTLERPLWLYGPKFISIGDGSIILRDSWLAVERVAWGQDAPVLEIGKRFAARPLVTISAAASIVIEDNVSLAAFSSIIDSEHTWGSRSTHALDRDVKGTAIHVGEGTFIAERAAILAGARIGKQCFIGANTVVKSQVPDYSIVLGVPGRIVGSTQPDGSEQ